ncbi:MAG: wax ester/triacylglycerol synthase family O-acyltransferase [Chitinophagales bacterium]
MFKKIIQQLNSAEIESISGMDAAFLYGETPNSHMHIGSVCIVEGSLSFETFRDLLKSRIHLIPRMRQRLVYVPMSIDYPYWVDDPNFNINLHLSHIAIPKPSDWKQLRTLASRIFSEPLDHSRPLWSFTFVEGLDDIAQLPKGSVAIITKMHHVAIDGVGGAGILSLLFNASPQKKPLKEPKPFRPKPLPNQLSLLLKSSLGFAEKPLKLPGIVSDALKASFKAGALSRVKYAQLPKASFTAPRTPLNGIVSPLRKWSTTMLSLKRIKTLKKIMGVTLNDVMLGICSGALRRYLLEKGKLPNKSLVAMVPVSTRTAGDADGKGNQISQMLVQLATQVEDPIERLETIHENTVREKTYQKALGAKTLSKMAEVVPFGIANQAARIYTRFNLSKLHNPIFNVTITNVPGPQFPLYINGHKLISVNGMAPVLDGMGLIITIFSYNGQVMVSSTSDENSMPDIDVFNRYIRESANELEALILEKKEEMEQKKNPSKAALPDLNPLLKQLQKSFDAKKNSISPNMGIFQFHLSDSDTYWQFDLNDAPLVAESKTSHSNATATFTAKDEHFQKLLEGTLNWELAVVQGRLKVEGDIEKAMVFGELI